MSVPRLVSVVIPCYNQGRYLEEALQSVFAQTYPHLEIVVVDDGSEDDTASIAARFGGRIRFLQQPNRGLSAARNLGLASCTGAYLQFLDCDDRIEPEKIRRQVAFLEDHPDVGIVYSDVRYFSNSEPDARTLGPYSEGAPFTPTLWEAPGTMLEKLIDRNVLAVNSALVRRASVATIGPWNESLCAVEDWEFWIRCAHAGVRFHYQDWPGTLALVRLHPESLTANPARITLGVHQMRVSVSRLLEGPAGRANCSRAIENCLGRHMSNRTLRFLELARATRGFGNRLRVIAAWLLLAPWAGGTARVVAWRLTPAPLRRLLSRVLGLNALRGSELPDR